jgi:hypothetical protein
MGGILFVKSFALFRKQYLNIEVQLFEDSPVSAV